MFKKLKEKKELEEKVGSNSGQKTDENNDSFGENKLISEDMSLNNSFEYYSDDSTAGKESKISDNNSFNNNFESNIDKKTTIDLLNDQILRLNNELISYKTLNSSLESQVRQLSDEKQVLNQQIVAKTEEVIHF